MEPKRAPSHSPRLTEIKLRPSVYPASPPGNPATPPGNPASPPGNPSSPPGNPASPPGKTIYTQDIPLLEKGLLPA